MPFIRVRDKSTKHEYDAPASQVRVHPEFYVVLDRKPVPQPRPPKFHVAEPPAKPAKGTKSSGGEPTKEES